MSAPGSPGSFVPQLPVTLSDQTNAPYALWKMLDLIDGRRDLGTIASSAGLDMHAAEKLWSRVLAHFSPTASAPVSGPVISDAVLEQLSSCLIATSGPMGAVMVDDALDNLPDDVSLPDLINALLHELPDHAQTQFLQRLRLKGLA